MRALIACLLAGCEMSSGTGGAIDEEPAQCHEGCVADGPPATWRDCCDSTTCYIDAATHKWVVVECDPPPPACTDCVAGQQCVQSFDGTCTMSATCVDKVVDCPDNACTSECAAAYCASPYQCANREPCGTEVPSAFTCYGP